MCVCMLGYVADVCANMSEDNFNGLVQTLSTLSFETGSVSEPGAHQSD